MLWFIILWEKSKNTNSISVSLVFFFFGTSFQCAAEREKDTLWWLFWDFLPVVYNCTLSPIYYSVTTKISLWYTTMLQNIHTYHNLLLNFNRTKCDFRYDFAKEMSIFKTNFRTFLLEFLTRKLVIWLFSIMAHAFIEVESTTMYIVRLLLIIVFFHLFKWFFYVINLILMMFLPCLKI